MLCTRAHNVSFYVHFAYFRPQKCYALSVWSAAAEAGNYRANLKIYERDGDDKEINIKGLLITSVEKVPSIDKCMEENGKYFWCIPLTLAKNFDTGHGLSVELDVIKKL